MNNMKLKEHASTGGHIRAASLSPERRKEIASLAAQKRWAYKNHVCGENCRCRKCNRPKWKHLTKEICFPFSCNKLPEKS